MAKCININHPDFKELVAKSNIHPAILAAEMGVWMEKNNTNNWPALEQLDIFKPSNVGQSDVSELKSFLQTANEITIKDIEKYIAGLADTFSKRKYNGHYTILKNDLMTVGFDRKTMARSIVKELNSIVPDLIHLEEYPIYYRNRSGKYLIDKKTNQPIPRGDTWLKVFISESALKDYLDRRNNPEFEFETNERYLTEDHISELEENIPEFKDTIGEQLPIEFDQFEFPEADPKLINIVYTEAEKVGHLLDEYIDERTNPMMLLSTIESRVGLSESNLELRKLLESLGGSLSEIRLEIINRNDLNSIKKGAFRKHMNDFAFVELDSKTNKRVIYLIKDNLNLPSAGSFDLLASTILHEVYHAVLYDVMENPVTDAEQELSKIINNLFRAAKSQSQFKTHSAYSNVHEFVANGLTNHKIVTELKEMKYNWWQRLLRAITNFFTRNTEAGVEGKSLTYYDTLFNTVFGYISKQRNIRPLLNSDVTLASNDFDYFIAAATGSQSLHNNAKHLAKIFENDKKSFYNFIGNIGENEAPFITVEHGLNIFGLAGVPSDLVTKEKDISKLKYNTVYSTIRDAINNYEGRTKIADKEKLISTLENKFGKDASVITNVLLNNKDRRLYDVVDFVVVHKYKDKNSPVFSIVNFYESNGTMKTFGKIINPKKAGMYRPVSKKTRERIRLSFSSGMLTKLIDRDHRYDAFSLNIIPISEDSNGNATLDSGIVELDRAFETFFLWSDNFDKARSQALDDLQSDIDLDVSEEVEQRIKELDIKYQMEGYTMSEADKLLQKTVKMLNTRANVSKVYGRKLAVQKIEGVLSDIILNYEEPNKALTSLVNYIHEELSKAVKALSETNMTDKKINKNALTAFIKMTKSFAITEDLYLYFKEVKEGVPELDLIREKIKDSLIYLKDIEVEYKRRALNLTVDYLAPYYSKVKIETIEEYKRTYRHYMFLLDQVEKGNQKYAEKVKQVPKNFDKNLTMDQYVASMYKINEESINNKTKNVIAKELVKAKKDIGYMEMIMDNILDSGDAVTGAFVKSIAILDDERRLLVEEKRMEYLPVLEEFEKYMANSGKVFTNYLDMYDFMLERHPETGELTGYILTPFSSELLQEKNEVFVSSGFYKDKEEAKKVRSAWLNYNMPINDNRYLDALWKYINELAESGKINEKELKSLYSIISNNKKYIDIGYFVDQGVITEEIGDLILNWIVTNQNNFREPSDRWITKQWSEFSKILENPDDPRTKMYNMIIELRNYADSLVPSSRAIGNRLPGVVKQKAERIASGQPIRSLISDSFAKTFTFQVDDTHRHEEIVDENKEALYFLPIHYNKRITKVNEDGETIFDSDNQSFDLFGIYMSYMSSAVDYNKKHSKLAEIDMFKNLMKQRELSKNTSLKDVVKKVTEKPSDILNINSVQEAVTIGGNIYTMLDAWLNAVVFGQYEKEISSKLGIDFGKVIEFIKKYTAVNLLGLNIIQGVANVSLGEINQWIESIAGEFFSPKDYAKAHMDYMKNLAGMIADAGSRRPANILTLIAQRFDIAEMPSIQYSGRRSKLGKMNLSEMAHLTSSSGEHFMRVKFMDSMLYEKKAFDKDGNELGSIRDFYSIENGKLVFDKDNKVDLVRSQWTTTDQNDFKQRLEGMMSRIHGDYSNLARVYLQQHPVASLAYMFRKFVAPGWRRHWGQTRYETRNLQSVEGMYITTYNFLLKPYIDAFKAKRNIEAEESEISDLTWGERWAMLSDHQRANLMRTALEMVNVAILMVLFRVLAGDDDDEVTYADEFIMYQLLRLKSEILFFLSPSEAMKIFRSPAASLSVFENLAQLFKQAMNPLEEYERGPWEGQLKIYKRLVNMVPVYRQAYRLRDVGDQIPWFQR